ncbi:MAG: ParB/RepB/Spo0J family partition protein [Burkholderiaceae bacterium]|nr:ParB/RepB/Spo0J family partition protein [Burkholderiaceae bacterium]
MSSELTLLPPPTAIAADGQTIVADELVMAVGTFGYFNLVDIRISKTNRRYFNEAKLAELAASIKAKGIAQPILIRPVTPTDAEPQQYEIVAGERRYRAAIMAGLMAAPVICRPLSDLDAAEIQILENLQRDDPHPLEEAEGYERLMLTHGYSADQLADKLKKSRSYIYGRLKLCALTTEVRTRFLEHPDTLPPSTALRIARIPVPALQVRALQEIMEPHGQNSDPMSHRRARDHIQSRYTLDLMHAPFLLTDAKLLDGATSCAKCPKRTGNQPEIYPDAKSADVCTDPDCYAEKKAAHYARTIALARKRGIPVHEGDEATRQVSNYTWNCDSPLVVLGTPLGKFERVAPATGMAGSMGTHLAPDARPQPAAYVLFADGKAEALFDRSAVQAALEKAGICESVGDRATRQASEQATTDTPAQQSKAQQKHAAQLAEQEAKQAKAAALTAERVSLYRQLRNSIAGGMSLGALRELVKLLVRGDYGMTLPDDLLGDLYSFEDRGDEGVCAYIDQADASEVHLLLVDLIVGEHLGGAPWYSGDEHESIGHQALLAMAAHEGIAPNPTTAEDGPATPDMFPVIDEDTDIGALVAANIHRIPELAAQVIDNAPHHLAEFEAAANANGFTYKSGKWHTAPTQQADDAPHQQADSEPTDAPAAAPKRVTIQLKSKPATPAEADGPIVKVKKIRNIAPLTQTESSAPNTKEPA